MKTLKIFLITIALMLVILSSRYGFLLLMMLLLYQVAFPRNNYLYKFNETNIEKMKDKYGLYC